MLHREMLIDGHFIGGPCDQATGKQVVRAPFDGRVVGTAAEGGFEELRGCLAAADEAFPAWRSASRHRRQTLLRAIAQLVRERRDELVELLSREVGKPITASQGEVYRLAMTFELAADEISRFEIEDVPLDLDARGAGMRCTVERFPRGPIFAIVPYNWPYNLAAHKIAPALATGNTMVLKPSPLAPLSTLTLARLIHEAGCPPGVFNAWNGPTQAVDRLIDDPRIKMLSFTGSAAVGWELKRKLYDRPVTLELGGDATAVVEPDADLDWAVERLVAGAFGYAGQICISIQHALVHRDVYEKVRERLTRLTAECPTGDPMEKATVCGPMISDEAADRVMGFVEEAMGQGARLLAGGTREGRTIAPTLLEDVPDTARLAHEEVFGPVLTLRAYDDLDEAIRLVNASPYGIHAGVFTRNIAAAEKAFRELEVGGVIVNDFPTLRFDNIPYGGVKRSGFGREGVRYAMLEMTEPKAMVIRMKG